MKLLGAIFSLMISVSLAQAVDKAPLEPPYTRSGPSVMSEPHPIPKPDSTDDEGTYYYNGDSASDALYYDLDNIPNMKGAAFVRFGMMGPFDIVSDRGDVSYEDIYTDKPSFVVYAEYEKLLSRAGGSWSLKFGTGATFEDGQGRFASAAITTIPKEKFTFLVFPNTVALNYKFRFSDTQIFTPYLEAGGSYFGFIEYRSDGDRTVFGGAPVLSGSGGLLVNMNIINKNIGTTLYEDYGVHKMWFDFQFRQNVGLNKQKDFTSSMYTAGFGFGF